MLSTRLVIILILNIAFSKRHVSRVIEPKIKIQKFNFKNRLAQKNKASKINAVNSKHRFAKKNEVDDEFANVEKMEKFLGNQKEAFQKLKLIKDQLKGDQKAEQKHKDQISQLTNNLNDLEDQSKKSIEKLKTILQEQIKEIKDLNEKIFELDQKAKLLSNSEITTHKKILGFYSDLLQSFSYTSWSEWSWYYWRSGYYLSYPFYTLPIIFDNGYVFNGFYSFISSYTSWCYCWASPIYLSPLVSTYQTVMTTIPTEDISTKLDRIEEKIDQVQSSIDAKEVVNEIESSQKENLTSGKKIQEESENSISEDLQKDQEQLDEKLSEHLQQDKDQSIYNNQDQLLEEEQNESQENLQQDDIDQNLQDSLYNSNDDNDFNQNLDDSDQKYNENAYNNDDDQNSYDNITNNNFENIQDDIHKPFSYQEDEIQREEPEAFQQTQLEPLNDDEYIREEPLDQIVQEDQYKKQRYQKKQHYDQKVNPRFNANKAKFVSKNKVQRLFKQFKKH